nr:type I-E CRISPR-associated protein Cse2/CasB [Acanthopleuribacter pedis]
MRRCRQVAEERKSVLIWSLLGAKIPVEIKGFTEGTQLDKRRRPQQDFLETLYLVAPLQAAVKYNSSDFESTPHPVDLATTLRSLVGKDKQRLEAVERRFLRLLRLPRRNLERQLFSMLNIIRGFEGGRIDWPQLYWDLYRWDRRREAFKHETVRTRWARQFFGDRETGSETHQEQEEK